jgi:hypothetical protein
MIAENIASYGFISTDNVTIFNSHLIKNSEWAAVSYLYSSIGQNNNYIVMDMNAGLNEYVASYIEQIGGAVNNAVNLYGSSLKEGNTGTDIRDVDIISLTSPNDKPESNFGSSSSYKGNAVYETSASGTGNTSLNGESSIFTQKNEPFMIRTGYYGYDKTSGGGSTGIGFRTTLIIK